MSRAKLERSARQRSGLYVSHESRIEDTIKDLLVEAAFLYGQPGMRPRAMIAAMLAVHRMAELDDDERVKNEVEALLRGVK